MKISDIEYSSVNCCAALYTNIVNTFKEAPTTATERKKKEIRKWCNKHLKLVLSLWPQLTGYLGKDVGDAEYFEFLEECHKYVESEEAKREADFAEAMADLGEEVKYAFKTFFTEPYDIDFHMSDDRIEIGFPAEPTCMSTLILEGVESFPEIDFQCVSFDNIALTRSNNKYRFSGKVFDTYSDKTIPFDSLFSKASVKVTVYRATASVFPETPWHYLSLTANSIWAKASMPGYYLNSKEKELLPLISELNRLTFRNCSDEDPDNDFPNLKSLAKKLGFDELLRHFDNLAKEDLKDKKKFKLKEKLFAKLNLKKYEPLWREIHNAIEESQAEYPSMADVQCDPLEADKTRAKIQKILRAKGYTGEYPRFVKTGRIRGVRLAESYGISYFVANEKNVASHIFCREMCFGDHISIEFLCGTQILRKSETVGDIYSCLFNSKGRSYGRAFTYYGNGLSESGNPDESGLSQYVTMAAKRAELEKLTKSEQQFMYGDNKTDWRTFFLFLLFFGGLFGLFFTLGMMAVGVLALLIFGQPQEIPGMLTDTLWLAILAFSAVGFGVPMSIITVLAKRK